MSAGYQPQINPPGLGFEELQGQKESGRLLSFRVIRLSSPKTVLHSCSGGQEAVLVVKSVQYGVSHDPA